MYLYYSVFFITTFLGFYVDSIQYRARNDRRFEVQKTWALFLIVFIYVVFVGCRAYSVGSDTEVYLHKLQDASTMPLLEYLSTRYYLEPFFYSLIWISAHISNSPSVFFIFCSLFYFSVLLKFSKKYSKSLGWSIWLINSLGFVTLAMSIVRQSMAISFCLLAYMYLDKNYWKSWLFFLLAFATHISAMIFFPMMFVYFLSRKNVLMSMIVLIGVATLIGPVLMGELGVAYAALTDKGQYENEGEGIGGVGMIVFLVLLVVMGVVAFFPQKRKKLPLLYYNEFIAIGLTLVVFVVSRFNLATMRLFLFYLIFSAVYLPNVFSVLNKQKRFLLQCGIFIISFYYLTAKVMASPYEDSRLYLPYHFFWE